jgi:hypothetical protein
LSRFGGALVYLAVCRRLYSSTRYKFGWKNDHDA